MSHRRVPVAARVIAAVAVIAILGAGGRTTAQQQDALSDSFESSWGDGSVSIQYTITGVPTDGEMSEEYGVTDDRWYRDEQDRLVDHRSNDHIRYWRAVHDSGLAPGMTVRLSGTITATLEPGEVAEVGMLAAIWVDGNFDSDRFPRVIEVCGELPRGRIEPHGCPVPTHGAAIASFEPRQTSSSSLPFELELEIPPPPSGVGPEWSSGYGPGYGWLRFAVTGFKVRGLPTYDAERAVALFDPSYHTGEPVRAQVSGTFNLFADGTAAPGDDLPGWTIAIGSGSAVLAAAATLAHRRRTDDPDRSDHPDDTPHHILQVSHDTITLTPHNPTTIRVQVWQLMPDGSPVPAAATITLTADPMLTLRPATGNHDLTTTVTLEPAGPTLPTNGTIRVAATTAHGSHHHTIATHHTQGYRLELLVQQ